MSAQLLSSRASRCCVHSRPVNRTIARSSFPKVGGRVNRFIVQATETTGATGTTGPKNALEVTDATFKEIVLDSEKVVLVDFWAPWCGPCRMISNVIDELAVEYKDKVVCTKLNTDECPTVSSQFLIRSIPTVMFFKNGQKVDQIIGAVPKSVLSQTLDKYV